MLLPALNKARLQAKAISCLNNLKMLGSALNQYTMNFNDYLIPYYNIRETPDSTNKRNAFWVGILCELPPGQNIPVSYKTRRSSYGVMWGESGTPHSPKGDFSCPAAEFGVSWSAGTDSGNYKFSHYHLNHPLHGGFFNSNATYQLPFYKTSRIRMPSAAIALAERSSLVGSAIWACFLHYETSEVLDYARHGKCSVLYEDGHTGTLTQTAGLAIRNPADSNTNRIFRIGYDY